MRIRAVRPDDVPILVDLTIEVFRPFYETSFATMVPPNVWQHQHGSWADDYRRDVPRLHDPEHDKAVAVAEIEDEGGTSIGGYIAWSVDRPRRHGVIEMLAVRSEARRGGVGRALVAHAEDALRDAGAEVVELGTGGDDFHAPARACYEALGFYPVPVTMYLKSLTR